MKRRKFLFTSGSAVLTASAFNSLSQQPAFALNFDLSPIPNRHPSNVDSLIVEFSKFQLVPRYVDFSKDVTIRTDITVNGQTRTITDTVSISDKQSISKNDIKSRTVIDNIDTTQESIEGSVKIIVEHESIGSESFTQNFTVADYSLTNGLKSYYPIQKGGGSILNDAVSDRNGTIQGANWTNTSQIYNHSLRFNGTSDKVPLPDTSELDLTNGFTVSAWVKPTNFDGSNNHGILTRWTDNQFLLRCNSTGTVEFFIDSDIISISGRELSTNEWYHVSAVATGDQIRLFVNGTEEDSTSITSIPQTSQQIVIGWQQSGGDNDYGEGHIEDVRIYNRDLSKPEIKDLYQITEPSGQRITESEVPNQTNNGVSNYKFDGNVDDSWSNNHGSDNTSSSSGYIDGMYNKAKYFNGTDDYITVNYGDGSEIIYKNWSVSAWINVFDWSDADRKEWLSITEDQTTSRPLDFVHEDGSIKHYRGEAASQVMAYDVSNKSDWHQMAVTQNRIDSSTVELVMYLDGQQVDSATGDYENMRPSLSFDIGRSIQDGLYWNGGIDDLRIYNKTLSPNEVSEVYKLGSYKVK